MNKVTPHFIFMRRAQNADTHALKQHRLSQNISPVCSIFYWLLHRISALSLKAKNVDFHTAKKYPDISKIFSLFLDEYLYIDLRPVYRNPTA